MRARALVMACGLAACAGGCAAYRPLPLAPRAHLAPALSNLDLDVPAAAGADAPRRIDVAKPLDLESIGLLAILNDPALQTERGTIAVAQARAIEASLLPNPGASLGYGALLGGPGTAPSYAASLTQDITAIVTYRARNAAAGAHVAEVNADTLWQEWQVAQKARLLALDLYWGERSIGLQRRERDLIANALAKVRSATTAGNLDLTALSPLVAAEAAAEQSLAALELQQIKNWQALDAVLGLAPKLRFAIAPPTLPPLPRNIDALIADLPKRRPDLVALRLGYRSADETLRAAILGQFPAFALGGNWSSDTTGVRSAGPTVTFDLPIFNRNQGQIAASRATRLLLHEEYQARLDGAVGNIRGLLAQSEKLRADVAQARRAAASAEALARTAQAAYAQGNLDQRAWTDYQTAALGRRLEAVVLERSLGETQIALTVELALGLPRARIAPLDRAQTS